MPVVGGRCGGGPFGAGNKVAATEAGAAGAGPGLGSTCGGGACMAHSKSCENPIFCTCSRLRRYSSAVDRFCFLHQPPPPPNKKKKLFSIKYELI